MSQFRNPESVTAAQGEVKPKIKPSEPQTTKGHQPGIKVGNDAAPEFSAEAYPPGTAPSDRAFEPNPVDEVPGQSRPKASETLGGATSAEVHQGFGHPGGGMTSQEARTSGNKTDRAGLEGVGASAVDPISDRGLDMEHEKVGQAGKPGRPEDWKTAEDRPGASAEDVAAERRG